MRRFGLIIAMFLLGGFGGGASGATFNGLYAATPMLDGPRKKLPDTVYQSDVFGVYVRLVWNVIEPRKGRYDWTTLDAETSRAVASGKQLSIGVATGSLAPRWLYKQGVEHARFIVDGPHARGTCLKLTIPVPWDPIYQQEYAAMLSAMTLHLQRTGAYGAVRVVKITPMNEWTQETRLPSEPGPHKEGGCREVSNAVATWQRLGYRPRKAVHAWREAAQSVETAFPGKVLGIAILDNNDFPLIDDNGNALESKTSPGWVDVKGKIIASGIRKFPGRFMVGWQALGQTETSPVVIDAGANGAIEAWQTNMHLSTRRAGCDSSPGHDYATCDRSTYHSILDNGISAGARYIEIWPNDLLAFPHAVAKAQALLAQSTSHRSDE